ncbi:MAG: rhodanese-like domain-containing protein [Cyanobacteria bacterium QS_8_64_29]|nr:MAG: rhodanese-like domain-containing protein [Cyanobacteria bacterium QS_8_64_29]
MSQAADRNTAQAPQVKAKHILDRLNWGEPAFSILDVRDRSAYNQSRIMGALSMPMTELVERARRSFEADRVLYVYGESDRQTAEAVRQLQAAGFQQAYGVEGGLLGWKRMAGPTEGNADAS